jgi:hypothetical protein
MTPAMKAAEEALQQIVDGDQRERQRTIDVDPAGNTYEIYEVDGPFAKIARAALALIRAEAAEDDPWEALRLIAKRASETSKEKWIDDSSAIHSVAYCALKGLVDPRRAEAAAVPIRDDGICQCEFCDGSGYVDVHTGGPAPRPAAVPADPEALARRLQARADELGTAYAGDKAMLVEAAALIRLRSWEEAIGRRSPEGSDNF